MNGVIRVKAVSLFSSCLISRMASKRPRLGHPTPPIVGSRLVACPVCSKTFHVLLITTHIETHFEEEAVLAGEPSPPDPGEEGAARPQSGAEAARGEPPGEEPRSPGEEAAGGGLATPPKGEAEEAGSAGAGATAEEGVAFGGALVPPPSAGKERPDAPTSGALWAPFHLQVMSGDYSACGLCLEPFVLGERDRFLLLPCQHARQCGPCALRVWTQPKARRRCPWCVGKLDSRPRAFRPFL